MAPLGGPSCRARRNRDVVAACGDVPAAVPAAAIAGGTVGDSALTLSTMTRELLDSFWRAAANCLHPKVIALSLLPLALVGGAAAALGYFFWEPAVDGVRTSLQDAALLETMFAWLRSIGGGGWASVIAPLVIVALAVPVFVVVSLLVAALLMTPAVVRLV